ncbi:serine/threonine protein kinase [Acaryochloris sp. IP29b_bin.137]|uniref:serine/threonine protein kinase n=1 Tax=Acaryochloris sp. IP29b_bin.137 TaxID=2969217 RepID=UPI002604F3C8|nr:serine/threonine protein kinase [Acaryochloris sp. IP29b_bin.137]
MTNSGANTPNVQPPQTPTLLNNRYRVIKILGDGGFGTTFLAEDTQMPSRRQCVIKQLKPIDNNPQIYQLVKDRFQREAAILERLGESHDQIPRLYAFLEEAGQFYLVEEWVAGQTLTQKMQQGPLSETEVREILVKLLPVIDYIHQQRIVHRDIKPDNIILRQKDGIPSLIDFGAVKETMSTVVNSQGQTNRSIVVGTPGYMPMEQLAGRPVYSSDLFSLGLTAIYLLTRKIPQEFETDPQTGMLLWQHLAPHLSPEFVATLNQAIHPHPNNRFLSAAAMMNRLVLPPTDIVDMAQEEIPNSPSATLAHQETLPAGVEAANIVSHSPQNIPPQHPSPPPVTEPGVPEPTQAVIPQHPPSVSPTVNQARFPEWQKAMLTGSIVGVFVLAGAVLLRGQVSDLLTRNSPSPTPAVNTNPSTSDRAVDNSPSSTPSSSTSNNNDSQINRPVTPPPVDVALPPNAAQTNARIVGEPGSKNIRSGPGTNYAQTHIVYPGDRIRIVTSDRDQGGFLWHNVYLPKSQAQGWIAAQLVEADQTAPPSPKPTPKPSPKPVPSTTNATIVGSPESKNIRTGPGTKFPTKHMAYPGDRVQIVGQQKDVGGYLWYDVFFPKSGARGWIAAQLIQRD